ncbi:helix-turn-helix domain-containing protein [Crossiella sp. NPDC003009]
MRDLLGRLDALDPDAGAAVKVIAYFDRLVETRAGLEAIVRGAAVLSGHIARLVEDDRGVRLRIDPDGRLLEPGPPPGDWPSTPVLPGGPPALWLESTGPAGPVGEMVLERAAVAARGVLDRAHRPVRRHSSAQTLLDTAAPEAARRKGAQRLGLGARARAFVLDGGEIQLAPGSGSAPPPGVRAGVGPAVPVLDLPDSVAAARVALRFAAAGTPQDPGPLVVFAEALGGLAVLASAVGPDTAPAPDVRALAKAAQSAPWVLATLVAVADSPSLRTAATTLLVHHSTLQERLSHAEDELGWPVRSPQGRLRLQLAIALLRLHRHG